MSYQSAADRSAFANLEHFLDELVRLGKLDKDAKSRFLSAQKRHQHSIDVVMTELGLIQEEILAEELSRYFGKEPAVSDPEEVNEALVDQLGLDFLRQNNLLPISSETDEVLVALADPFDRAAIGSIEFLLERPVDFRILTRSKIRESLDVLGSREAEVENAVAAPDNDSPTAEDMDRLQDIASEAPVVRFVTQTIQSAVDRNATDIHLEPAADKVIVRCRIDGMLHKLSEVPKPMYAGIVTRIKVLSQLNIAERRRPQDGRMRVSVRGRNIDLRVSILASIEGETVVLRILDKSNVPLELGSLGFDAEAQEQLTSLAQIPSGIILATGPTGSGKTTTLYALIQKIMRPDMKIFTIENPVEYKLEQAVQLQVNPDIDFTFANALRSVLRQDPDVILVGEIRDRETADIAIRASLTGHLVFSTLHTNSAVEAVTRLRDMGLDSFMLAATIRGIIAQRLLRTRCMSCDTEDSGKQICPTCNGTGFSGRSVCYEILPSTKEISEKIASGAASSSILELAKNEGMTTLHRNAQSMVARGVTSPEEVARVVDSTFE